MKVQELIKQMSEPKNKLLKTEQLQSIIKKTLDVKDYTSIKNKKELVESIVNECIFYEDGIFKFDDIDKYICFTMRTLASYTNLELSSDIEEDYDLLCESKLLDLIINTFKKEYDDVNILLQMRCDYMLNKNSLEAQVGRLFENISDKLDGLVDTLSNKVDGLDFKNLPIGMEDLSKFMKLINMQK
jgi:hypothetical protein